MGDYPTIHFVLLLFYSSHSQLSLQ